MAPERVQRKLPTILAAEFDGYTRLIRATMLFAVCLWLASCTSKDILMTPTVHTPLELSPVARTVGFYLSDELLTDIREADPYGGHPFNFPVGQASAGVFRSILPKMFSDVVEVSGRPPFNDGRSKFDVVIEPQIDDFRFWSTTDGSEFRYWAEIRYRFNLYSPGGELVTSWTTKGTGASVGGPIHNVQTVLGGAADSAVENAATEFMKSFDEVPEAKRWVLGLPTAGATAAADKQETRPDPKGRDTVLGVYEGIVAVRVNRDTAPSAKAAEFKKDLNAAGLLAVQVSVRNDGHNRLRVRRSDIALMVADGRKLNPIPYTVIARAITARHRRLASPPAGVGIAAIPLLLVALVNAAAAADELAELRARMAAFQGTEIRDALLRPGETAEGFVFFASGRDTDTGDLTVSVPVVDADTVTRYIVRVPLSVFKPYKLKEQRAPTRGSAE